MRYATRSFSEKPENTKSIGLDEFLNAKKISRLERLLDVWSVKEQRLHSKLALIRQLRQAMLDKENVRKVVSGLDARAVNTLQTIIRTGSEYASSSDGIIHLERMGLIHLPQSFVQYFGSGAVKAFVPDELKPILVDVLEIDLRTLPQVVTLAAYLDTLSPEEYEQTAGSLLDGAERDGTREKDLALLLDPEHISKRIATLPDHLKKDLLKAVYEKGGILYAHKELVRKVRDFRRDVASKLLGTVREIPLEFMGYRGGDGILVFADVTRALLTQSLPAPEKCDIHNREIDTLSDFTAVLEHLYVEPVKVKQGGGLYKASIRSLASILGVDAEQAEYNIEEYVSILKKLKLVRISGNEITPSPARDQAWFAMTPQEQLERILAPDIDHYPPISRHFQEAFTDALKLWPPDVFLDTKRVASQLTAVLLEKIAEDETVQHNLYGIWSYNELIQRVNRLVDNLIHHGVMILYYRQHEGRGEEVCLQFSEVGKCYLGLSACKPDEDIKALFVNPDFEVIIYRHGSSWLQALAMARFAKRLKTDQAYHFRIERKRVEAAVLTGLRADEMLGFLHEHSRTPVPQNVEYSIRDWASSISRAMHYQAYIIEVDDSKILDVIMQDEQLQKAGIKRIAPTVAAVNERITRKAILERLRSQGIFLQNL